ncbi:hypothetical protein WKH57_27975 [Niallia taxi]|uniref:hypothetical protein n=1 Tax=Niallia taxi TaxID=2499688 RepID=UPI003177E6AE
MDSINFEDIIKLGPVGLIPLLLVFLSFGTNNFNAQSVEIKLMTNVKKISMIIYYLIVVSIVVAIFLEFSLILTQGIGFINQEKILFSSIAALFFALGIAIITISIILTVIKLMGYKNNFFIKDDSTINQSKWYIIRRVDSQRILLSDNMNSYKFIQYEELTNLNITREDVPLKGIPFTIEKITTKWKVPVYVICSILLLISIFVIELTKNDIWNIVGTISIIIVLIFLIIVFTITTDVKEINNN